MSKTTFDSEELIKIIKKINTRIDKLQCFIIECCSKIPINIGNGFGLYKKLSGNHWQFKSLKEGNNITITEDAETLTITSSGGGSSFTCTDLNFCSTTNLPEGANLYYTNPRAVSALIGQNISIFTNNSGYITSSALSPYLLSSTASSTYEPIITSGTISQYWRGDKTWQTFPSIPTITPSSLTKVDDTNVTLTLGGTPNTSLLEAVSLTLGWTGTLADNRIASASVWNAKQAELSGTGIVKSTAGTISYLTDNSTNWDTAYTNRITSLTTTGSGAASLTSNVLNIPTPSAPIFASLTTTGSSGASTLTLGVLNVPTYTLSGLGGIGGSGTSTQLAFFNAGSTITSDSLLVWENTSKWLGIGMTPIMKLQVSSSASSPTLPVAQLLRPNGTNVNNKSIGYPYLLIGGAVETGTLNVMASIGFGYNYSNIYYPFVEIGSQTTSTSGNLKGDFWIATRPTTTNVAATERIRVLSSGETGFGTSSPNTAALVDITSTTKGFLPPRMTTTQKNAISSPPAGLQVYDSTLNKMCFYNGSAWETITSS